MSLGRKAGASSSDADEEKLGPSAERARILVVDDSPIIRDFVSQTLAGPPLRAEVVEAEDGALALRRAFDEQFDCIICDIMMPKLDGMSFLKQLRTRFSRLELPLVFLTVREATRDKVAGFRAGASDFLVKPIETEELMVRVETQVRLARMHRRNIDLTERLQVLVETDPLTGLGNRRVFMTRLAAEFGRAQRNGRRMGLLVIDIDRFKSINDSHGHQAGDAVLCEVAAFLETAARQYDTVARIGGEEFAVLLPEVEPGLIQGIAERFRLRVETGMPGPSGVSAATISIGAAVGPCGKDDGPEKLFGRADEQLYVAKKAGRNRVSVDVGSCADLGKNKGSAS